LLVFADPDVAKKVMRLMVVGYQGPGFVFDVGPTVLRQARYFPSLLSRAGMTAKWQQREISNFDYLMFLNMAVCECIVVVN
jgi:hypothetical protein